MRNETFEILQYKFFYTWFKMTFFLVFLYLLFLMEMFFGNVFGLNRLPFLNHLTFFFHLVWGLHLSKVGFWQLRRTWWPKLTWIRCFFCTADTFAVDIGLTPREIKKSWQYVTIWHHWPHAKKPQKSPTWYITGAKSSNSRQENRICTKIKSWTLHKVLLAAISYFMILEKVGLKKDKKNYWKM